MIQFLLDLLAEDPGRHEGRCQPVGDHDYDLGRRPEGLQVAASATDQPSAGDPGSSNYLTRRDHPSGSQLEARATSRSPPPTLAVGRRKERALAGKSSASVRVSQGWA
jgi:hypothetical protein